MKGGPSITELITENERLRKTVTILILEERIGLRELRRICREKGETIEN